MLFLLIIHLDTTLHQLATSTRESAPSNKPSTNNNIQEVVAMFINEEKQKAKRHLNLIIHNVPESPSEDGLTRKDHDDDFVIKMRQTPYKLKQ